MGIYERNYYRDESEINLAPSWNRRSAVSTLLIANVVVYVANILLSQQNFVFATSGTVNTWLSLSSKDFSQPWNWWRIITYGFVHSAVNPFHLIWNMLGLYFLGRAVESRYGTKEFYRIYFVALFVCSTLWLLKQWLFGNSNSYLLGASGAVICVEMLFVYNFPTSRIFLFVFPIPAWLLGVILVLTNLMTQQGDARNESSMIAYDVHMIGILFATVYFFAKLDFRFLENLPLAWRRFMRRWTGPRLKVHRDFGGVSARDTEEADRILAKIHESGQDSLTTKEKKFLEKYSRSIRDRQKQE